jgi:hypothetical protein
MIEQCRKACPHLTPQLGPHSVLAPVTDCFGFDASKSAGMRGSQVGHQPEKCGNQFFIFDGMCGGRHRRKQWISLTDVAAWRRREGERSNRQQERRHCTVRMLRGSSGSVKKRVPSVTAAMAIMRRAAVIDRSTRSTAAIASTLQWCERQTTRADVQPPLFATSHRCARPHDQQYAQNSGETGADCRPRSAFYSDLHTIRKCQDCAKSMQRWSKHLTGDRRGLACGIYENDGAGKASRARVPGTITSVCNVSAISPGVSLRCIAPASITD